LEPQHWQKERVKWQERTTVISVSAGSFSKILEVGVTALRSVDLSRKRWNNIEISQFIERRCNSIEIGQFIEKRCGIIEIGQFIEKRFNSIEIDQTLPYFDSRKFFNFHELIVYVCSSIYLHTHNCLIPFKALLA
jgi:hypothetical protein